MVRLLYWFFGTMTLGALIAIAAVVYIFWHFGRDLPDYTQLKNYEPPITTRIYASDGNLVKEFATENRLFVPIDTIPERVVQAFLSAEDKNFFDHPGIDFLGMVRAVVKSLRNLSEGKRLQGASTITQQVATNFLLNREQKVSYKIRQILLSFRLEKAFSKKQILELYLNEIYLGRGVYGVASAALNYFGKSLDELDVEEAAYLAALPKGPNNYHPIRHYEKAMTRRNWVISRMFEDGVIIRQERDEAIKKPLKTINRHNDQSIPADFFVEEVRRQLMEKYGYKGLYEGGMYVRTSMEPALQTLASKALRWGLEKYDRNHGWRGPLGRLALPGEEGSRRVKVFGQFDDQWSEKLAAIKVPGIGEWKIAVVLDSTKTKAEIGFQDSSKGIIALKDIKWARKRLRNQRIGSTVKKVSQVLKKGDVIAVQFLKEEGSTKFYSLEQIPDVGGAIVVMDPHTGRVLAISGGYSYELSEFNRATQAMRQPGSSFKPFVYLTALNQGYSPATFILDAPVVLPQGPGLPLWRPRNYSREFYGPTPLRVGIEKSRNLMTVRLAYTVGMDDIASTASKFGIYDNLPKHLSLSLGAGETTVLKMTAAYAMLVNGGKKVTPTFIDRIQDRKGQTLFKYDKRPCENCKDVDFTNQDMVQVMDMREQVTDPRTAYQMVSILQGVVQRGTARRVGALNIPVAGKTGTSNDAKDTWFVGFTPNLTIGVFVGFDQPRTLGKSETGSSVASPIFKKFVEMAVKKENVQPFRVPDGLSFIEFNGIMEAFIPGTEPGAPGSKEDIYWGDEVVYDDYEYGYGEYPEGYEAYMNNNPGPTYQAPPGWEGAQPPSYHRHSPSGQQQWGQQVPPPSPYQQPNYYGGGTTQQNAPEQQYQQNYQEYRQYQGYNNSARRKPGVKKELRQRPIVNQVKPQILPERRMEEKKLNEFERFRMRGTPQPRIPEPYQQSPYSRSQNLPSEAYIEEEPLPPTDPVPDFVPENMPQTPQSAEGLY